MPHLLTFRLAAQKPPLQLTARLVVKVQAFVDDRLIGAARAIMILQLRKVRFRRAP